MLSDPSPISIDSESKTDVTGCFGDTNGTITITASGGTGTLTYILNPVGTSNNTGLFTGLSAGTYTVDVFDENGCGPATSGPQVLSQPPELVITGTSHTDVDCSGEAEGTITVNASGGTGTIYYTLNPGSVTNITGFFDLLVAGTYIISITDDNGCGPFDTPGITINEPDLIQITGSSSTDITCNGLSDGTITVTATGGTGTLTYTINPGGANNNTGFFSGLSTGIYTVAVSDENGCGPFSTAPLTISEPAGISIDNITVDDVSCFGGSDGTITILASGGTGTLTYTLNPGSVSNNTGVFPGLSQGSYTISISDENSCPAVNSGPVAVSEPPIIQIDNVSSVDVSCNGGSDGSITVAASGGTGLLSYTINPGGATNNTGFFPGLSAGTYTVSISDENGCGPFLTPDIDLDEPDLIQITSETGNDISCFGLTDGSITVTATGGTAPLTYTLNPGGAFNGTGTFAGLGAGAYTVSVTDGNGCVPVVSNPITINEPTEVLITNISTTDISCNGLTDGSITVTASGGTGSLQYTLFPGPIPSATGVFTGLGADSYTVSVTDANGCGPAVGGPVTIHEPAAISAIVTVNDALCNGESSGSISIAAAGGTAPYEYSINGGIDYQPGSLFTGLSAGSYQVMVRDNNTCALDAGSHTISEPDQVTFTHDVTGITCYAAADGIIEFTALGGTPPYEYSIYGNFAWAYQASNVFSGLSADTYELVVRDANNCVSGIVTVTLTEPSQIFIGFTADAITTCFGDPGTITLTASGGSGNFEYSISTTQWTPGVWQASGVFNNLSGGVPYYGFVRDVETNCLDYANGGNSITISQPAEINYSVILVNHVTGCSYDTNGEIRISSPSGGSPPFTYYINGVSNGASRIFSNLGVNTYLIEAVDSKGCRKETTVVINGPAPILIDTYSQNDITTCWGDNTGSIDITAVGGTGALSYSINGSPPSGSGSFTNLTAGDYLIVIRDVNNCMLDTTVTLSQPDQLDVSFLKTNVTCFGDNNGSITITASGGTSPYDYSIDNGLNFFPDGEFTGLGPGDYDILVRDANACLQPGGTTTVYEPAELIITGESSVDPTSCPGDPGNGSITITATGGTPTLVYSINGGLDYFDNGGTFTGLPTGSYDIVVRDSRGCFTPGSTITLTGIPDINVSTLTTDILCFGQSNGSIDISASGGGGTFEYSIDNGVNYLPAGLFTGLAAGDYQVMVRDNLLCTASGGTVSLNQPDELIIDEVQITNVIIGGPPNGGELNILVSGGTPAYEYSIDGGLNFLPGGLFTGLTTGIYDIVVRDASLCEAATTAEIEEVPPFDVSLDVTAVTCNGDADGTILLAASNGVEPFEYSINGGADFFSSGYFPGLSGGTYHVIIRDGNGITWEDFVSLHEPDALLLSANINNALCNLSTDDGSIDVTVTGGTSPYNFLWSNGFTGNNPADLYPGDYTLSLMDANGCLEEETYTLGFIHEVNVDLGPDVSICPGDSHQLDAQYSQSGTTAIFSWSSSPDEPLPPIPDPEVSPITPTLYTITLTDENGCEAVSTKLVDLYPVQGIYAGPDTIVQIGRSITLEALTEGMFVNYSWSPATWLNISIGPVVEASPLEPITYTVTAITADGCYEMDSVFVDIARLVIPAGGLTPNNDGINDFWEIENASDYPNILVEVFNRFGQKVFSTTGYSDDRRWDGTFNGKDLPVGTYYFVIKLNDSFGTKPMTGPVTIVR